MTDLRTAAQQALEAMERRNRVSDEYKVYLETAITALRAALKNAEVFNAELSENTRKNMDFVKASLAGKRSLTCVGCEGFPAPSNSPCAVCGSVALEQPEQEPELQLDGMTPLQFALEELHAFQEATGCDTASEFRAALEQPAKCDGGTCGLGGYCDECPKRQPEQEPVAWIEAPHGAIKANPMYKMTAPQSLAWRIPLYTHPPRREWRGLTDTERAAVQFESFKRGLSPLEFMELHEAKLKERNA